MSLDTSDKAAVEKRLWDDIEDNHFGMLGATNASGHFVPMTAHPERESRTIWFFTSIDSDLAVAAETGVAAAFIVLARNQNLQACLRGQLRATRDRLHVEKYWGGVVGAWFPKGKDDPSLILLRLDCEEAEVWVTDKGPVGFGWEIAKANLTGAQPEIGGHAVLIMA